MGDTIVIETPVATVLEVSGLQGPQGPTGPQGPSGEASGSIAWSNVTGKPSTFTPSAHTHTSADVTDFAAAVVAAAPPTTNASLLTSGTLPDARLSAAVTTSLGKADTASQPGHTHTNFASLRIDPANGNMGSLVVGNTTSGQNNYVTIDNKIRLLSPINSFVASFDSAALSADRAISLPDASGTIALTSNTVSSVASSASDVLGVSGANITGVDANATRLVYWNNTSNKLAYGTPSDAGAVASDPTGVSGAGAITNIMSLTQAEYNAIGSPDAATLYLITDPS